MMLVQQIKREVAGLPKVQLKEFSISSIIDDLPSVFQYLVRLHDAAFQGHQGGLVGTFGISL